MQTHPLLHNLTLEACKLKSAWNFACVLNRCSLSGHEPKYPSAKWDLEVRQRYAVSALRLPHWSAQNAPVRRESWAPCCTAVAPTVGEGRGGGADAVTPLFHSHFQKVSGHPGDLCSAPSLPSSTVQKSVFGIVLRLFGERTKILFLSC